MNFCVAGTDTAFSSSATIETSASQSFSRAFAPSGHCLLPHASDVVVPFRARLARRVRRGGASVVATRSRLAAEMRARRSRRRRRARTPRGAPRTTTLGRRARAIDDASTRSRRRRIPRAAFPRLLTPSLSFPSPFRPNKKGATVLVVGATGGVGQLVVAKLPAAGYRVRAAARSSARARATSSARRTRSRSSRRT